jgi:hypothetical protein
MREFKQGIDARVSALQHLPAEGLTNWLAVEHLLDSLEANSAFPEIVTTARRLYHLRVQVTADPEAMAQALFASFDEAERRYIEALVT